jgi:branched-chain amino acid aminotransferase
VQLYATTEFVRAAPGGTGGYKLGANYAPGVAPQALAAKKGYSQNLWLLGDEHALTEVGTMNLFIAFKKPDGSELCAEEEEGDELDVRRWLCRR